MAGLNKLLRLLLPVQGTRDSLPVLEIPNVLNVNPEILLHKDNCTLQHKTENVFVDLVIMVLLSPRHRSLPDPIKPHNQTAPPDAPEAGNGRLSSFCYGRLSKTL